MRKLPLLSLPALLPAGVGLWLEQRHAARVLAAVANGFASGWQRLRIAAFGFDEAVIVSRDGTVENVSNGGSDLPDSRVIGCVLRTFYELKFPASPEGIVTVTYPLLFQPSDT